MGRDTAGRLIVKTREPFRCVPTANGDTQQEEFAGVVVRRRTELVEVVESLRGRMSEAGRQVEGLFESLLHEAFHG